MMFCLGKLGMHQANDLAFNLSIHHFFKNIQQLFNRDLNWIIDKIKNMAFF